MKLTNDNNAIWKAVPSLSGLVEVHVSCGHLTISSIHYNFRILVQSFEIIVKWFNSVQMSEIIAKWSDSQMAIRMFGRRASRDSWISAPRYIMLYDTSIVWCAYVYIYIYIYVYLSLSLSIYIYIYIYTCICIYVMCRHFEWLRVWCMMYEDCLMTCMCQHRHRHRLDIRVRTHSH